MVLRDGDAKCEAKAHQGGSPRLSPGQVFGLGQVTSPLWDSIHL